MLGPSLPLFLVPDPAVRLSQLRPVEDVTIHYRERGWYMSSASSGKRLFSFDLPGELFLQYAGEDGSTLSRRAVFEIKQQYFSELPAYAVIDGVPRPVVFRLQENWSEDLEAGVVRARRESSVFQESLGADSELYDETDE